MIKSYIPIDSGETWRSIIRAPCHAALEEYQVSFQPMAKEDSLTVTGSEHRAFPASIAHEKLLKCSFGGLEVVARNFDVFHVPSW